MRKPSVNPLSQVRRKYSHVIVGLAFIRSGTNPNGPYQQTFGTSGMTLSESSLKRLQGEGFERVIVGFEWCDRSGLNGDYTEKEFEVEYLLKAEVRR